MEKQLSDLKSDMERTERDIETLERQIRNENDSKQRDYYRPARARHPSLRGAP